MTNMTDRQLRKAHTRCFPRLLHYVLDRVEMEGISDRTIGWAPSGLEFIIYDHDRFAEEVVPRYFPHQIQFRSFIRQLNLWGFRRVSREMHGDRSKWRNEFFRRGQHELIPHMKRHGSKKAVAKAKDGTQRKTKEKNEAVDSDGEKSTTAKNTNQLHSDDRKVAAVATSFETNVLAMAAENVAFANDASLQRENGYVMKKTEYEMLRAKVSNNQLINKAGVKREEKRVCQGLKRFQDLLDMKNSGSILSEGTRVLEQDQINPNTMTSGELRLVNKINATQNIVDAKDVRLSFVQKRGQNVWAGPVLSTSFTDGQFDDADEE